MRGIRFTTAGLPELHAATLVVRARPAFAAALSRAGSGEGLGEAPGVDHLVRLAAFGALHQLTVLGESSPDEGTGGGSAPPEDSWSAGAFATPLAAWAEACRRAAFAPPSSRRAGGAGAAALAGAALVELADAATADELLERLCADAAIESASRVPARYLLRAEPRRRPADRAAPPARGRRAPARPAAVPPPSPQWNLARIRLPEARAAAGFREASAVEVAVLDTGVDRRHPDLARRVAAYRFAHPHEAGASGPEDIVGHGTHVAGTIAANPGNALGVAGICSPRLHVWKIFSDRPLLLASVAEYAYVVDPAMYRRALADCSDRGMSVVNLSIGGPAPPDAVERALYDALAASGATVVAAMGNERRWGSPASYPAAIPGVVAVAATTLDDRVADFSSRGAHVALAAPGVAIWSTLPSYPGRFGFEAVEEAPGRFREGKPLARETGYDAWNGTSMAAPHVTAAAALLLAREPGLPPHAVKQRLMATADLTPEMGGAPFHPDVGAGRLNLERLL